MRIWLLRPSPAVISQEGAMKMGCGAFSCLHALTMLMLMAGLAVARTKGLLLSNQSSP